METTQIIFDIISIVFGGSSLVTLVIFLINRRDMRKSEIEKINKQLVKLEKDSVRTQLLILMENYTDADEQELLTCAEHYFSVLCGNWYMTSKFKRFLKLNQIETPTWFKEQNSSNA